ncbi:TIGR03013 family XrtA/PEP-CTERM system glycosyltransferase [Sphingomonas profundi]|uniref:TIGR03013 family XrtA/PEP-CTERM system glycosyltransferase n=1 Tax=Alterirhizorhabdus profundi TaxID=2681549 RepID=UPI0012E91B6D|nr:TIGR03013 family XrtA/PEP-CTERM system glycosyltransferase [Sphingomonas profundi]
MIRLFKHYIPYAVLLLGIVDFALLLVAAEAGWRIKLWQIDTLAEPIRTRLPQLLSFAIALECALIAVGAYGDEALQSLRFAAARLLVAVSLGVILISLMFFLFPELTLWRSNSAYAMGLAIFLLILVRALFGRVLGGESFKRRVLVLGAGARASRIAALARQPGSGFVVVGYVAMNEGPQLVPEAIDRRAIESLGDHVVQLSASEVVLALDERRNALPLKDLLRIKTTGVHVNEISTFLERETGRVDLDSVNPSWLIFSDGFSSGRRLSSMAKRVFDLAASLLLLVVAAPVILVTAVLVKLESQGPAFFRQQRVGLYGQNFWIPKLRSMKQNAEAPGTAVWAEKDDPRITRIGRVIRKIRVDELPQVWSVLKGEMSFVGPRPERPQFVAELEKDLSFYAERHMVKPGITGWAQINYPYGASLEDARHKLEYDLYYAKNYTPFLDMLILLQTVRVLIWPDGAR